MSQVQATAAHAAHAGNPTVSFVNYARLPLRVAVPMDVALTERELFTRAAGGFTSLRCQRQACLQ